MTASATLLAPDTDHSDEDRHRAMGEQFQRSYGTAAARVETTPMASFEVTFDSTQLEPMSIPPYPYAISGIGTGALRYVAVFKACSIDHAEGIVQCHFKDAKLVKARENDGTFPALLPIHTEVRGTIPTVRRSLWARLFGPRVV